MTHRTDSRRQWRITYKTNARGYTTRVVTVQADSASSAAGRGSRDLRAGEAITAVECCDVETRLAGRDVDWDVTIATPGSDEVTWTTSPDPRTVVEAMAEFNLRTNPGYRVAPINVIKVEALS